MRWVQPINIWWVTLGFIPYAWISLYVGAIAIVDGEGAGIFFLLGFGYYTVCWLGLFCGAIARSFLRKQFVFYHRLLFYAVLATQASSLLASFAGGWISLLVGGKKLAVLSKMQ
jgi:hypothetical protein